MIPEDIHSCSVFCHRPECCTRQRDQLRDYILRTGGNDALSAALNPSVAPPGCVCDPEEIEWEINQRGVPCAQYTPNSDREPFCVHCSHDRECHAAHAADAATESNGQDIPGSCPHLLDGCMGTTCECNDLVPGYDDLDPVIGGQS